MALYALDLPLEKFWDTQNLKMVANDGFLDNRGNINDDVFYFKHLSGVTKLDFSVFDLPHIKLDNIATLTINGQHYPLTIKNFAKLAVASTITPKNCRVALPIYKLIMHLGAFLKINASTSLGYNNIEDFHISYLSQVITKQGFCNRLSPESYKGSYKVFDLPKLRNKLKAKGIEGFLDNGLTKKNVDSTLDNACQTVIGLRLPEYKDGGSFNFLGLEMGQYYVDYMKNVYESDYFYSLVCEKALLSVSKKFQLNDMNHNGAKVRWEKVLLNTIQGTFVANKHEKFSSKITRGKLHSAMKTELENNYEVYFEKIQSLSEDNILDVIQEIGLTMRFDSVEIIRTLMLTKYYPFDAKKTAASIWESYLNSLDKSDTDSQRMRGFSVDDLYLIMLRTIANKKMDNSNFMLSLSQWSIALQGNQEGKGLTGLTLEIEREKDAMTSLMVAWLGYRKGEFGFPLKAIHVEPNLDILDNSHVPFRFKLKWVVPKTNGNVKIDREITSQCYQISAQLGEMFEIHEDEPCLYNSKRHKSEPTMNESGRYIETRIKSNWKSFIKNYQPFKDANRLQSLSEKEASTLTKNELIKLESLQQCYELASARVQNLIVTSNELNRDIKKLNCTAFSGKNNQASFKCSLIEFNQKGCISNIEHKAVVEQYLSDETKSWLLSNEINIDQKAMIDISKELLQGVRYPSPHAFRHIWAEAVLTRYQGDVGAVIRHQFCHLDDSFFMAYLRDKEPKDLVRMARMKVLNSIVDVLLVESNIIGQEYLGGFARYVKKAVQMTKTVSKIEQLELRDRILQRIISVQSSHFATCIPREGGEARGKCSEFGDINPHNAKPEFCWNCIHALISSRNLKGIWLMLQPFVKESLDQNVMGFMIAHHLPILRSGYKVIKEFRSDNNAESVDKILSLTARAIDNIKQKLKAEEVSYA